MALRVVVLMLFLDVACDFIITYSLGLLFDVDAVNVVMKQ